MKTLIKPTFIMSFIVMLTGLSPQVAWWMPLFGIVSLAMMTIAGVALLGSEDREYLSQLELIRIEHAKAQQLVYEAASKYTELENRISKAISENRTLVGQLR